MRQELLVRREIIRGWKIFGTVCQLTYLSTKYRAFLNIYGKIVFSYFPILSMNIMGHIKSEEHRYRCVIFHYLEELITVGTHLLLLHWLLAGGGDFGRRCALARASFQQVNSGGSRTLVVLEIKEHVLVEGEVLVGPAAVFGGLLAQGAALRALFTRNHRQIQSVALIVADPLLHFSFTQRLFSNWNQRLQKVCSHHTPTEAFFPRKRSREEAANVSEWTVIPV